MTDARTPRRNLESLKKEAKRWLVALRANDIGRARAPESRAFAIVPAEPALRDVQHALAREHGFAGWIALKEALEHSADSGLTPSLARYETMAQVLIEAYRTGTPEAMERLYQFTWHRRSWQAMRTYLQLDLGIRDAAADITLDDARRMIALEHGFADWHALDAFATSGAAAGRMASKPVRIDAAGASDEAAALATSRGLG